MASGLFCVPMENNLEQTANFNIDFNDTTADRFKCMLTTSSWTPDYSADSIKTDVSNEVSGAGYSAGGESLTSITFATATGTITWDAGDVERTASTITGARYAVIYDDTLTNKPLICAIDFGGDFSTTSGTFKITWNASGIFTLDLTP